MTPSSSRHSALVLDGELRHCIDIVRSLGRRGWGVDIVTCKAGPPAGYSVRLRDQFLVQTVQGRPDFRLAAVQGLLRSRRYDVVLAAGLEGGRFLADHQADLCPLVGLVTPTPASFRIAEDKWETVRLAERAGVAVPRTLAPTCQPDLEQCRAWDFPVVVKARGGQGRFGYAESFDQLVALHAHLSGNRGPRDGEPMAIVQQYVRGTGHGYFALCQSGKVLASFMHKRLHEVPPTGGPSSLACSYYDSALEESARRLLAALEWSGVAMVEFKRDTDSGRFVLMEVNPKFWGSLGLAVAAGVDFPWLLTQLALTGFVPPVPTYRSVRYQWLSMDIAHSLAVRRPLLWLHEVARRTPNDFQILDPLPTIALIAQGIADVARGRRRLHPAVAPESTSPAGGTSRD